MRTSGKNIFEGQLTIGVDLGDRSSAYCVLNEAGKIVLEQKLATTPEAMKQVFGSLPRCRIAMETGTHSPWISRLLTALGHEVIVAHAQKVRLITKSRRKDDRLDARTLARLTRIDPELLSPSETSQCAGAAAPDGDPCTSGTGELANRSGECRSRIGEVLRRAAAQVWHATVPSGDDEWIKRGIARSVRAVVARGGIAQRTYPGIRSADYNHGQTDVSGNGVTQTGEGCGRPHRHGLCADHRGPPSLSEESRRGTFCGFAARA